MPLGPNVAENVKELRSTHPDWGHDRILAAALEGARSAGNDKIKPPSSVRKRKSTETSYIKPKSKRKKR